jgi:hypothetical protein
MGIEWVGLRFQDKMICRGDPAQAVIDAAGDD